MKYKTQLMFSFLSRACPQIRHLVAHLSSHSARVRKPLVWHAECWKGCLLPSSLPVPALLVCMCYRLNVSVPHAKVLCWNLIPNVMVLWGGAFGSWLGHEGRALMNEIPAFTKETPKSSLATSSMWEQSESTAAMGWKVRQICWFLDCGLPAPSTVQNKWL